MLILYINFQISNSPSDLIIFYFALEKNLNEKHFVVSDV